MTPDPQGGVHQTGLAEGFALDPATLLPAEWYDRSSLVGDFLVMIDGQTEGDYLRRSPEKRFCEFIDGIVYMQAAASDKHQSDVQFFIVVLECFLEIRGGGLVFSGPATLRPRVNCILEPDLFVLPPAGRVHADDIDRDPPALLVVEVLSPSTRSHDLQRKSALYREAGTAETWFVDDRDHVVIVERRTARGYESSRVESGPIRSTGLPGFWFDADWLWARPRPRLLACLDQILAGPPPG